MRQEHDRYGNRFFHAGADQDGAYVKSNPKLHPENAMLQAKSGEIKVTDCGRDTGDECTNHKPQPRQHGDECTNTHNLRSKL